MSENIQIAIISAGLATLVNCIFEMIKGLICIKKEKREYDRKKKEEYQVKKEEAYKSALERLLWIRVGFDYKRSDLVHNDKLLKELDKRNEEFLQLESLIRLYATDEIYNMYYNLSTLSRYAYSDGPRLFENSKRYYNSSVTVLARRMQDDLGYRQYLKNYEEIMCPECGNYHDIYSDCPNCGLKYSELQEKIKEIRKQMQEEKDNLQNTDNEVEDNENI